MAPAPNAVGSSFSTRLRLPSSYDQPDTGIFVMILTLTSSFANWVTSTEKSCISAFADAALFASADSAFTVSRYFAMASLPEKPLVLNPLTV